MKKLYVLFFLFLMHISIFAQKSIDVVLTNEIPVKNIYQDAKVLFFKDILFLMMQYDYSVLYFDGNSLVSTGIPKIKEGINWYDTVIYCGKTKEFDKLIYKVCDYQTGKIHYGYELLVNKDNNSVDIIERDEAFFLKEGEEQFLDGLRPYKFFDIYGNSILYTSEYNISANSSTESLTLYSSDSTFIKEFVDVTNNAKFLSYAVNDKMTKVVLLYNTSSNEGKIQIFSLTYDGVINDTRVRLRSKPNLNSEVLGFLNTGDKLKVVDWSNEKQKIGGMEAYWYKVESENYPDGWVYGKYVDIVE